MAENKRTVASFVLPFGLFLILMSCQVSNGTKTDFECLQLVRNSLSDPYGYLSNWDFTNKTEGSICRFNGIECWYVYESRVLNIKLANMGLQGLFPYGLVNCTSLTGLNLRGNNLHGSLPSNISEIIPYVTELDICCNNFSGPIPKGLANVTYLNGLNLAHNMFSGQIPLELGNLPRIKTFSVADNNLSGQIPSFTDNANITKAAYKNNSGICGKPIFDDCPAPKKKKKLHLFGRVRLLSSEFSSLAFKVGQVTTILSFILTVAGFAYKSTDKGGKREEDELVGERWVLNTKGAESTKVCRFDKTIPKMTWGNLVKATEFFSCKTIIVSEMSGIMYKATLRDGTCLMIKRLQNSYQTKKEFLSEVTSLGNLKHPSLVPLLGYCIVKKERILVYKYMPYGNLYGLLHPADDNEPSILGWPIRLKIAIEVAEGLTWLDQIRIHGKVSSKSILLDHDFKPKFYELGLKRFDSNLSQAHFSTFARGEIEDMWFMTLEFSNVYSFGKVLLELITGEKSYQVANAPESFKGGLVEWIHELESTNSDLSSVIDKSLFGEGVYDDFLQFLRVACSCVSTVPKERPTISQVYRLLKTIGERYTFGDIEDGDITSRV